MKRYISALCSTALSIGFAAMTGCGGPVGGGSGLDGDYCEDFQEVVASMQNLGNVGTYEFEVMANGDRLANLFINSASEQQIKVSLPFNVEYPRTNLCLTLVNVAGGNLPVPLNIRASGRSHETSPQPTTLWFGKTVELNGETRCLLLGGSRAEVFRLCHMNGKTFSVPR